MKAIAITGSKGKTTIEHLLTEVFMGMGKHVLHIGTEGIRYDDVIQKPEPGASKLEFKQDTHPIDFAIIEAISNTLRRASIPCHIAVFTNIEHNEHGDVHGTFENYLKCKKRLFDEMKPDGVAIVNADDPNTSEIIKDCKCKIITFGRKLTCDYVINNIKIDSEGTNFTINGLKLHTSLLGEFNIYNIAASVAILNQCDIISMNIAERTPAPGRFERFNIDSNIVILDYAHTVNSLEKTLQLIRKIYGDRNLVTVFGCGGARDRTKRPMMGKIALNYSDYVYVTTDNPRCEKPEDIISDIVGANEEYQFDVILDREDAIHAAINENTDSIILIAGRGNETECEWGDKKIPMEDRKFILSCKK